MENRWGGLESLPTCGYIELFHSVRVGVCVCVCVCKYSSKLANLAIFLVGLGFELRTLCLQTGAPSLERHLHFTMVILEMRSHKLFV
jgi:hypothetical protein